ADLHRCESTDRRRPRVLRGHQLFDRGQNQGHLPLRQGEGIGARLMITGLGVRNFKRFLELSLPLRPLTVLTGLTGAGNSTLSQSLLLARQAAYRAALDGVALNGVVGLALGEAEDIQHPEAEESAEVAVRLEIGGGAEVTFGFRPSETRALN